MNYYRLKQANDVPNILMPECPYASDIWSECAALFLRGSVANQRDTVTFLPFYEASVLSKAFLISSEMWSVWEELQSGGRNRPCAFGHMRTHQIKPYRLVLPRLLEVLHKDTEYYKDGTIQTICLKKSEIGTNQIFTIKGAYNLYMIVSEYVLEEMYRKKITGLVYDPIEMGGE